jgi:beta-glucosidase
LYPADGKIMVSIKLKNGGTQAGNEVVQLYASKSESKADRPEKELKGFTKVWLEPGEMKTLRIPLNVADLAYFDAKMMRWKVEEGTYKLMIGSSSRDIKLSREITVSR